VGALSDEVDQLLLFCLKPLFEFVTVNFSCYTNNSSGVNLVQNVGGRPVQGVWEDRSPQWGPGANPR